METIFFEGKLINLNTINECELSEIFEKIKQKRAIIKENIDSYLDEYREFCKMEDM